MQAKLEPTANPDSVDNERFQVHSRLEIVTLLREVADAHSPVTIYFNQGTEFIVTSPARRESKVSEELIYGLGADAGANQRLLKSAPMTVVTFLNNIEMQFPAQRAEETTHEQLPVLRIPMPNSMLRLQRRNS